MSQQMRAAWGRRTDTELLHAYFAEELSPYGRQVVAELVAEKVGSIPSFVASFAAREGEVAHRLKVRACTIGEGELPEMKGVVVLAEKGLGFLPRGRDDDEAVQFGGVLGVASQLLQQMRQTASPISDLTRLDLPVPLLARLSPSALWLPLGSFDALIWSSQSGEVLRAGERLLAVTTRLDARDVVATWATRHGVTVHRSASGHG